MPPTMPASHVVSESRSSEILEEVEKPTGRLRRMTDFDEAEEALTEAYAPHQLRPVGPNPRLELGLWTNDLPGLGLGYVTVDGSMSILSPSRPSYIVCITTRGHVEIGSGREWSTATRTTAAILAPAQPAYFERWSSDCHLLTARLSQPDLENVLASLLGRPVTQPLSFDVPMDLSSPRSASFVRALQLLHGEVQRPDGMTADPAMAAGMTRLVMTGLLLAQPHNYTDQLHDPTRSVAPATIRNAIEFIEAEPEQVMTVSDVAAVACLSVRALEDGFRRHVGVSPMTYVRDIRLARVHLELSTVDPETTTAAAVARRWGFNHYSRFAALYRERYSVAPAKTLAGRGGDR